MTDLLTAVVGSQQTVAASSIAVKEAVYKLSVEVLKLSEKQLELESRQVNIPHSLTVSAISRNNSETETTPKPKRISAEMQKAIDWLKINPDMQGLSLREAAAVVGVSYSTINRAKELI